MEKTYKSSWFIVGETWEKCVGIGQTGRVTIRFLSRRLNKSRPITPLLVTLSVILYLVLKLLRLSFEQTKYLTTDNSLILNNLTCNLARHFIIWRASFYEMVRHFIQLLNSTIDWLCTYFIHILHLYYISELKTPRITYPESLNLLSNLSVHTCNKKPYKSIKICCYTTIKFLFR